MALELITRSEQQLSSMFSSPLCTYQPILRSNRGSSVKNLRVAFDNAASLPLVQKTTHPDLKRISSQTLASLLQQQPNDLLIIDARYPFEYVGGHITSARNIYTEIDLQTMFYELISSTCRPSIIVFHCEFSSERGPRLCRLFRSVDRQYNINNYPYLSFPSIYLLDGGYAEFYHQPICQVLCEPVAYVSMFEQEYSRELQHYRHKKKVASGRVMENRAEEKLEPIPFCVL